MAGSTVCPGCRVELPASNWEWDSGRHSSPECWQLYGEVTGFELNHPNLLPLHQITVDAYGAQHVAGDGRGIRAAYSLVGLHLAIDRGLTGVQVRSAHQEMGKPDATWPGFSPPPNAGALTVLDVAEAGVRADSVAGHAAAIPRWAAEVWRTWTTAAHRRFGTDRPVVGGVSRAPAGDLKPLTGRTYVRIMISRWWGKGKLRL